MSSLQATSGSDSQENSSSSSDVITADEEEYEQPIEESIVNTYIGGPLDAFSRPTQVLSGDEVRRLPPAAITTQFTVQHFAIPHGCNDKLKREESCPPTMLYVQVLRGLYNCVHENAEDNYLAFYSSRLGGITLDPALMVVPMDDHLVHRGHAVFDTATMTQVLGQTGSSAVKGFAASFLVRHCGILEGWVILLEGYLLKLPLKGGIDSSPCSPCAGLPIPA